jgi:hypothetical protein
MGITDATFVEANDKTIIDSIVAAFYREWGNCKHYLVDAGRYYTLMLEEFAGPDISEKPCSGKIDLFFGETIVKTFRPKVRDFRLEWDQTSLTAVVDIFKDSVEEYKFPKINWEINDPLVWKNRLDEKHVDSRAVPSYWKDLNPVCETICRIIYNKNEQHPAIHVRLGFEQDTVYLLFCNLDFVDYSVLELIAAQSCVVDIKARAWEKRLDIRIKAGKPRNFADRFIQDEEERPKRKAESDENPAGLKH